MILLSHDGGRVMLDYTDFLLKLAIYKLEVLANDYSGNFYFVLNFFLIAVVHV